MAAWVGFGFLLAAAIVAAAVVLRPTAEQPTTEPATVTVPTPEVTAATRESGLVRLRIGSDFPTERRAEIVAALEAAGLPPVQVEALPFRIMTSRVGYYRAEDREAAEKLAQLVQPVVGDAAGEVVLRDYAELLSDAEPGRLDLWVGN
jgi:hypothetical protein